MKKNKLKLRTFQENFDAITNQGELYASIPDGYEAKAVLMAKDIGKLMKKFSSRETEFMAKIEANGNPDKIIPMFMAIQSVTKTGLESFISKLSKNNFGTYNHFISDLVGYEMWKDFDESHGSDFVSGVTTGKEINIPKISGIVRLMFNGNRLPEHILQQHPWLRSCSKECFLECADVPMRHMLQKTRAHFNGSRTSHRGLMIQKYYSDVLTVCGVEWLERTICKGSRTWDNVVDHPFVNGRRPVAPMTAIETSFPDATGSSISDKTAHLTSDMEKVDCLSIFVGGGTGWALRPGDAAKIAESLDMCFGPTEEEALAFFSFVVRDVLKKRISKTKIHQIMEEVLDEAKQNTTG
jgi:hypothetical protein